MSRRWRIEIEVENRTIKLLLDGRERTACAASPRSTSSEASGVVGWYGTVVCGNADIYKMQVQCADVTCGRGEMIRNTFCSQKSFFS